MARIVVFDTETTGTDPLKHDIIQIACLILYNDFTPDKTQQPFHMLIKPAHFRDTEEYRADIQPALNVNKLSMKKIMEVGYDPIKASELFEEWWRSVSGGEPLEPLCQNYPFDAGFLKQWLGPLAYQHFFSRYYRDTYVAAHFLNDRADFNHDKPPFKNGLSLTKIANALGVEHGHAHEAYSDCLTTAEVYRRMCMFMPIPVGLSEARATRLTAEQLLPPSDLPASPT